MRRRKGRGNGRSRATVGAGLALAGAAGVLAYVVLRPRMRRWGATDDEVTRTLPGDDIVDQPNYVTTLGITIHARPDDIWPWLLQLGYQRGGLYSYDWLDRLFGYLDRPSATEVLPEFQELAAGDTIPIGRGPSWPVAAVEPLRALVLEPVAREITWAFALLPQDERSTRLVTRVRCRIESGASKAFMVAVIDPAAFIMTRKMLLNLKRRAEALARHDAVYGRYH